MKKCNKCKVILTENNVAKKNKTQWRGICKKCRVKDVCEYQKNHPEKSRLRNKKWRRKNGIGIRYPCKVCGKLKKRTGVPTVCSNKCKFFYYIKKGKDCWEWIGGKNRNGYGKMEVNNKTTVASRFSYELFKGPIPEGKLVCHTCDNPSCINPEHLWIGTVKENAEDMVRKGRHRNKYSPQKNKKGRF